ncbi:MAG: MazG-like family protein [Nanoarchaeota archaeon]|nr:MazG-like family protein [Nanoarchaeota archaeon]
MNQKNLRELQTYVKIFVDERNWQTPASDILIHMVEELGEVARNVLKMKNYGGQHTSDSGHNMPEELADVFYLLLKLANESNVDLVEAFSQKMEKNSKRFPPVIKSD